MENPAGYLSIAKDWFLAYGPDILAALVILIAGRERSL